MLAYGMKIIFHGAAREVGKSCIEIQTDGQRYILDAGVKFVYKGIEYPKYLDNVHELDGVFISHAHLDHSGALPMLEHKRLNCPIYLTKLTWKITNELLEDSYHLELLKHVHPAYVERDIHLVEHDLEFVKYDKEYFTKDKKISFQFLNSGHIPGGASILMNVEGKKLLYTADINTEDTLLMVPSLAEQLQGIDILITENTYGERKHPDRKATEEGFLSSVKEGLAGGGSVLIPVFSVGRAQEVLMLLARENIDAPIYLDGMPRRIMDIVMQSNDPYINNRELLESAADKAIYVHKHHREEICKRKGLIIVSSSGMVQGGPSVFYAEHMIHDKNNFLLLTGFQASGTTGRSLFEDHVFYHKGKKIPVQCHVRKFDFSAHYGQDSIINLQRKINAKHLILQHGDLDALEAARNFAEKNTKSKVYVPEVGEEIIID